MIITKSSDRKKNKMKKIIGAGFTGISVGIKHHRRRGSAANGGSSLETAPPFLFLSFSSLSLTRLFASPSRTFSRHHPPQRRRLWWWCCL
ncbi:hypothetical protein Hanom_Chr11g01022501 [Helianthus anomalus]